MDLEKGVVVMAAVQAAGEADWLTLWLARWFGEQRLLNHLGYEYRLSRLRRVWFHTDIREVA